MKAMREKALKPGTAEAHPTKMGKVMHEFKHKLHSSSKEANRQVAGGEPSRNGYSEMCQAGQKEEVADVPAPRGAHSPHLQAHGSNAALPT